MGYPRPILSLPSAYPLILSHAAACLSLPSNPFPFSAGGGPAHLPHSLLSNPFLSPRCAAAACRQGDGKRSREVEPDQPQRPHHPALFDDGLLKQQCESIWMSNVCEVRASAVGPLCSAYPQPILSLPSAYPLILSHPARGDGGGGGDAAAGELGGESARRLAAPGGLRPPMPLEATEAEAQPTLSLSSAYPQPTL